MLDVRDGDAIDALAAELGEVDIVFSNATARMSPDADPADEVDAVAETSNLATTRILRAFAPRLRPGGRLIIVASALGTLDKLHAASRRASPRRPRPRRRRRPRGRVAPRCPREAGRGRFGTWLNIPSKVAQVAAVRALARERRAADLAQQPRSWRSARADRHRRFPPVVRGHEPGADAGAGGGMAGRPRPRRPFDPAFYGELVQFGKVLPWETGIPVAHSATA